MQNNPLEKNLNIPHCINLGFGEGGNNNEETGPVDKRLHTQNLDFTALHIVGSLSQGHRNCNSLAPNE